LAAPTPQWSNPIVDIAPFSSSTTSTFLPAGTNPGTVYALKSTAGSLVTTGFAFNSDKNSIVTLGSSQFVWSGAGSGSCTRFGFLCAYGNYAWIEAKMDGYNTTQMAGNGVAGNTHNSRVHQTQMKNVSYAFNGEDGGGSNNLFDSDQLSGPGTGTFGFAFGRGTYPWTSVIDTSIQNFQYGIISNDSSRGVFQNINIGNVSEGAFSLGANNSSSTYNQGVQITVAGVKGAGGSTALSLSTGNINPANQYQTLSHLTVLNSYPAFSNATIGESGNASFNTWSDIVVANIQANSVMLALSGTAHDSLYDLTFVGGAYRATIGFNDNASTDVAIDGTIRFSGSAPSCNNSNADPTVQLNGSCNYGTGTAKLVNTSGGTLDQTFVGLVNSDAANGTSGLQLYGIPSVDWVDFISPFRVWGFEGTGTFMDPSRQNACAPGQICRMYDTRLSKTDTNLLNAYGPSIPTSGVACPSIIDGAGDLFDPNSTGPNPTIIHDRAGHYYLKNAVEVEFDDAPGANNNGLCESGEKCIYAPNAGAYQGEGDFTLQSCLFHNGPSDGKHLQNVTMYYYPINGQ